MVFVPFRQTDVSKCQGLRRGVRGTAGAAVSHADKGTFHTATALKWPCGARGRSYRRIDMGGRPARSRGCPRAVDVGPLCSPNRRRGAPLEGEQLLLIDVVNAHGAVILQTIWGRLPMPGSAIAAPRSRPSPTSTTW